MSSMDSNLWLEVSVSPGAGIDETCAQAIELANKLGLTVWFEFNGVKCGARPGDEAALLVINWRECLNSNSPHKIACANPRRERRAA